MPLPLPSASQPVRGGIARATAGYFVAFVAMGLVNASLGPTLPGLAAQTGSALGTLGILFSARALGFLLTVQPVGWAFDRRPHGRWLGAPLLALAVGMALMPLSSSVWMLLAILLVLGVAEAALDVAGNSLLAAAHGARAGAVLNALHFFYAVGALLAPLVVAAALAAGWGIPGAYWALAALLLPVGLGALTIRPPVVPRAPPAARSAGQEGSDAMLVLLLAALLLLHVGAEVGLGGWWATYALQTGLTDAAGAAVLTSVYWGGFAAGRLAATALSSRWLPRHVLVLHLSLALAALAVVALWPPLTWVGVAVSGWGLGPLFATAVAFAGRRVVLTGRVASLLFTGAALGSMTLPWVAGQFLTRVGPAALLLWSGALLLAALVVVGIVVSQDGRRAVPPTP